MQLSANEMCTALRRWNLGRRFVAGAAGETGVRGKPIEILRGGVERRRRDRRPLNHFRDRDAGVLTSGNGLSLASSRRQPKRSSFSSSSPPPPPPPSSSSSSSRAVRSSRRRAAAGRGGLHRGSRRTFRNPPAVPSRGTPLALNASRGVNAGCNAARSGAAHLAGDAFFCIRRDLSSPRTTTRIAHSLPPLANREMLPVRNGIAGA